MYVSILVAIYKDIEALSLIVDALKEQTYKNFELIVAEDNDSDEVKKYLASVDAFFPIKHYFHADIGLRKAIARNASVRMSEGEYLIFIDGDTIPYTTFIESHVALAEPKKVLCGRRVNLEKRMSDALRHHEIRSTDLERVWRFLPQLLQDKTRHIEQGLRFKPNGIIQQYLAGHDQNIHMVGSNFSCFKADIVYINGCDESMQDGPGVDDTDLEWRFIASGVTMKSCKCCANLFHLDHSRNDRQDIYDKNVAYMRDKQQRGEIICPNGIVKLQTA